MELYWHEQSASDVPTDNNWLSEGERGVLSSLHISKRREDWRLGRWTAKRAVAAFLSAREAAPPLAEIEIRPAPSGKPEVFLEGCKTPPAISISHRAGVAACALTPASATLGCDLEICESRSASFVADYFTPEEQAIFELIAPKYLPQLLALFWSAKESALKAMGEGLRLDTRSVRVLPELPLRRLARSSTRLVLDWTQDGEDRWWPLQVLADSGRVFHGWWLQTGTLVRTLAADPPPCYPSRLRFLMDGSQKGPSPFPTFPQIADVKIFGQ